MMRVSRSGEERGGAGRDPDDDTDGWGTCAYGFMDAANAAAFTPGSMARHEKFVGGG